MCLLLCLFSAILLGILYLFFGAFSLIFGNVYGFNLWQTGLAFLGIMVGMLAASTFLLPLGLLAYHCYLIWAGMTTNESQKWADWRDDMVDGVVFNDKYVESLSF